MSNYIETAEKTSLPLLPLRGAIAFPNVQLTLEILRPSSLRAFGEAASKKALMFLVSQKDPSVDEPSTEDFYKMGTICQIRHVTKNPDGHLSVTFEGICRASTTSIVFSKNFFHADVVKRGVHLGTVSSAKAETLAEELFELLEERGYNPVNQIVGYLMSGDLGYISSYKECRTKIAKLERSTILEVLLKDYLTK